MEFVRIKENIIRLDQVTRISEGRNEESHYGRSVRKGTENWVEVHFVGGEMLKLEGEAAEMLRRFLDRECAVRDLSLPMVARDGAWEAPVAGAR